MITLKSPYGSTLSVDETLEDLAVPRKKLATFFADSRDEELCMYRGCIISRCVDHASYQRPAPIRWSVWLFCRYQDEDHANVWLEPTATSISHSENLSSMDQAEDLVDRTLAGIGRYELLKGTEDQ